MTSVCCYGIKHKFSSEEIPTSKGSMTFKFRAVLKPNLLDVTLCTQQTQTNHKFLLSRTGIRIYVHSVEDILQCLVWCLIIWKVKSYNEGCSKVKETCQYRSFLPKGKAWNWSWQTAWDQNQELNWSKLSIFTQHSADAIFSFYQINSDLQRCSTEYSFLRKRTLT